MTCCCDNRWLFTPFYRRGCEDGCPQCFETVIAGMTGVGAIPCEAFNQVYRLFRECTDGPVWIMENPPGLQVPNQTIGLRAIMSVSILGTRFQLRRKITVLGLPTVVLEYKDAALTSLDLWDCNQPLTLPLTFENITCTGFPEEITLVPC